MNKDTIEIYTDFIDNDGYVQRYNYETQNYYNTGICLKGAKGNPGRPGKNGDSWDLKEIDGVYYWFKNGINTQIPAQYRSEGSVPTNLAKVASTGNYNDLSNKPTIPTKISDLTNDSGFLTEHQDISGKADKSELFSGNYDDLLNKPTIPVVPTNVSAFNNDIGYLTQHQDISGKEDMMDIVSAPTAAALSAEVGKYYTFTNAVETMNITLPSPTDVTKVRTIVFYLTTGATPAITFSSAIPIYCHDGFQLEAGNTYEINALFNGAAWIIANVKINVE